MQSVYRIGFLTIRFAGLVTPYPMDASIRSGVNEGRVVSRKPSFDCAFTLSLSSFIIRFCKERRTERRRLTNLHDLNYA